MEEKRIKKNLDRVQENIEIYSPKPEDVILIAVTKYFGVDVIEELLDFGIDTFGENKAQVLKEKYEYFKEKFPDKDIKWHFIGNLQKNKVKYIAPFITLIHSVNKLSLVEEIDKRAKQNNRVIDVLIEINVSGEESKEGYIYHDFMLDLPHLLKLENINIIGLMTMAPFIEPEACRSVFGELASIQKDLNKRYFNGKLTKLSMGMSNDYQIALEEGANLIRIGRKLYE